MPSSNDVCLEEELVLKFLCENDQVRLFVMKHSSSVAYIIHFPSTDSSV